MGKRNYIIFQKKNNTNFCQFCQVLSLFCQGLTKLKQDQIVSKMLLTLILIKKIYLYKQVLSEKRMYSTGVFIFIINFCIQIMSSCQYSLKFDKTQFFHLFFNLNQALLRLIF